jgi:rubrerythrin
MEKNERLSALEVALNNEMTEHEFYLKNARRTNNPVGKMMFETIAKDELEHHERLKEIHERWAERGAWPETVPLEVAETNVKKALVALMKGLETLPAGDGDDLEAVRTAIDFEKRGKAYYATLSDAVSDPKEKSFFLLLSQIENEHYLALVDTEEYLADPTSWFRRKEHQTFDAG